MCEHSNETFKFLGESLESGFTLRIEFNLEYLISLERPTDQVLPIIILLAEFKQHALVGFERSHTCLFQFL